MGHIKETWTRGKGASDKLQQLRKLENQRSGLLQKADDGDLEAYKEANLLAIKIQSIEDRLQGKASKVIDQYQV
jgi:hypothetical protein